ncbi:LCP family protein [Nocardia transvalensis]|uniref:LCP family protein n=1 Tax=Nocardia transvalensis TaxID=37333 RepID=UPI00189491D4|nr:LCP family protein [Nocardia transvalensis]MBF6331660.1 LCP family protein [Nocardia transvalensis]
MRHGRDRLSEAETDRLPVPPRSRGRHARPRSRARSGLLAAGRAVMAVLAIFVVVVTGAAWRTYNAALGGVTTSDALPDGPRSLGDDQNILIMGLDSRLDQHGKPLPQDMYDALHAGDESVGGYNANVLILVHIPGDGSRATAISIPRDDYVTLDAASCESAPCKGKIKQAYGFAYQRAKDRLSATVTDPLELERQSREAGRKAEMATVQRFLGNVPIDHFVEVTLVAFFQIAQVVQPITVCLNEDTSDSFSGANFRKGVQQIDAAQAMAFVRQRRDPNPDLNFTDLDRTRRQQAFIVSLARKLQETGVLTSPGNLRGLLDVAKQNIAIDSKLDPMQFAQQASVLVNGGLSLYTLPVEEFGTDSIGEDINIVDVNKIRTIVRELLSPPGSRPTTTTTPAPTTVPGSSGVVLNVVNSSGRQGLAAQVAQALTARGFTAGYLGTGAVDTDSTIAYGPGAETAALALAEQFGLTATPSTGLDEQTIELTIGTAAADSGPIAQLSTPDPTPTATTTTPPTATTPPTPVPATAPGAKAPAPTDLSSMDANGIPCVK